MAPRFLLRVGTGPLLEVCEGGRGGDGGVGGAGEGVGGGAELDPAGFGAMSRTPRCIECARF